MTVRSLQAWVLHKQWSGDTSARVTFFTREAGLIQCLCRGGRTPKKQSLLQAFMPLWVAVEERHNRYYANKVESTIPSLPLIGHALFSALYVNELLYHALSPAEPEADLYEAYLHTLQGLSATQDQLVIESFLRRFEWALLKVCGQSFSWTMEARMQVPLVAESRYQFIAGEGFILAQNGLVGQHILALAEDKLNEVDTLKTAKIIMRKAIDHLLGGREIKARALYAT